MKEKQHSTRPVERFLRVFTTFYYAALFVVFVYLWFVTQNRYISESMIKVTSEAGNADASEISASSSGMAAAAGLSGAQMTNGYISSADLLLQLEKEFGLVEHYCHPPYDFVFRLKEQASIEERIDFYRKRITSRYDLLDGVTIISVDTFDRDLSLKINRRILELTEGFINGINRKIANQQLSYYVEELSRAEENVARINKRILEMQDEKRIISPESAVSSSLRVIDEMYAMKLSMEAEIATLERDSPDSPRIELLRSRLRTQNESLDRENAKLSGDDRTRMNLFLIEYKDMQQRLEFAMEIRNNAEITVEENRAMRNQHTRFFILFQEPFRPEKHGMPLRAYATVTILVVGFLLFLVIRTLLLTLFERS
jgi:capsular polysaccharide transport system permease protein